tara:strand:+ start:180 stop:347 length:168 start_codon:yes stop_codon:yes gene_type:complete
MKYYQYNKGRAVYFTTERVIGIRKYGGRKSKEEKKRLMEESRLKIKKGKFMICFD